MFTIRTLWVWLLLAAVVAAAGPRTLFMQQFRSDIVPVQEAPHTRAAIIFGAGLTSSGHPTTVLADRIATGAALYEAGRVDTLIMSGSTRLPDYDEPAAMRAYALRLGVPANAIEMDRLGNRTYETCLRARDVYGLEEALLVTQSYHLPRALAICTGLGMEVVGISADRRDYRALAFWTLRELPAAWIALWDLYSLSNTFTFTGGPHG